VSADLILVLAESVDDAVHLRAAPVCAGARPSDPFRGADGAQCVQIAHSPTRMTSGPGGERREMASEKLGTSRRLRAG